jgi:hypothetical protein
MKPYGKCWISLSADVTLFGKADHERVRRFRMIKQISILGLLACVTQLHAAVRHSSDLGWTAGQDVSTQFAGILSGGTIEAGDELKLDHTYRISGTHQLADDFTLSAIRGGGFEVTDVFSAYSSVQVLRP